MMYEASTRYQDQLYTKIYQCDRPSIAAQKLFSFLRKKHPGLGPIDVSVLCQSKKIPQIYRTEYKEVDSLYATHRPVAHKV